jgi:hypothetical protein
LFLRFIGLIAVLNLAPTPHLARWGVDVADDRLAAGVDMDVLNADGLFPTATQFRQGLQLNREGPQEFIGHIPVGLKLCNLFCPLNTPEQLHCRRVSRSHLNGKHCLDLILRANAAYRCQGKAASEPTRGLCVPLGRGKARRNCGVCNRTRYVSYTLFER